MLRSRHMKRRYLFTLEIVPLYVGRIYNELPSHLTLMSRFLSYLSPEELAEKVRPLFMETQPVSLSLGETIQLGPKKVIAHMVDSSGERRLHNNLCKLLDGIEAEYQYPDFIGHGHKPHITEREGMQFTPGSRRVSAAAYLIEVVEKKRVVRAKLELAAARNKS